VLEEHVVGDELTKEEGRLFVTGKRGQEDEAAPRYRGHSAIAMQPGQGIVPGHDGQQPLV
jgi:hypothetical protein